MTIQVDFQRAALNLRNAGLSLATASRKIGRHKEWLAAVARGSIKSVEFHDGLKLLDLHLDVCGESAHRDIRSDT